MNRFNKSGMALLVAMGAVTMAAPAMADSGAWVIRGGVSAMDTNDESATFRTISRSGVRLGDAESLALTAAYFVSDVTAIEFSTAFPFTHDVRGNARLKSLGIDRIAEVKEVPTTIGMQFYLPNESPLRPYAGIGVTYTYFYDEEMKLDGVTVDFDDTLDFSGLVGVDLELRDNLLLHVDARYIHMDPSASFTGGFAETIDVDVHPWVYTLGVGYRF